MKRLIVLRPEPGASETVRRVQELGLDALAIPLFKVEQVAWAVPNPAEFDALLLTSANAVRHGGQGLRKFQNLPVHAVGQATADAAQDAGFRVATIGNRGIDELLSEISPRDRLLHLSGQDRRQSSLQGRSITAIPVYRAAELATPAELEHAENSVVLVHSPRAGHRFADLAQQLELERSSIAIAAISTAAADAVGDGWSSVDVAEEPTDAALLALAVRLCDKPAGT